MGLSVTALGAIICAIGMFFLVIFFPIGVFLLIVSGMIMASGVFKGKNAQSCICPYCEKCGRIAVGADGYTCPACNKRSIRRGNHLYAAEET